jgi:hypothetical protein
LPVTYIKYFAALAFSIPLICYGERVKIDQLAPFEECIYRAQFTSTVSYWLTANKVSSCEEIPIVSHGDETEKEKQYINKWKCEAFKMKKDPFKTGDIVYDQCMKEIK